MKRQRVWGIKKTACFNNSSLKFVGLKTYKVKSIVSWVSWERDVEKINWWRELVRYPKIKDWTSSQVQLVSSTQEFSHWLTKIKGWRLKIP